MNQQRCIDLSSILAALVVVIVGLFAVAVERGCTAAATVSAAHTAPATR